MGKKLPKFLEIQNIIYIEIENKSARIFWKKYDEKSFIRIVCKKISVPEIPENKEGQNRRTTELSNGDA